MNNKKTADKVYRLSFNNGYSRSSSQLEGLCCDDVIDEIKRLDEFNPLLATPAQVDNFKKKLARLERIETVHSPNSYSSAYFQITANN